MRIAYLNPSGQVGGAELCLLDMVAVLRDVRSEWNITVILGEKGPLAARAQSLGAKVIVLPFPSEIARLGDSGDSGRTALALRMLRSLPAVSAYRSQIQAALERIGPEVIHTNGFKMHVLGALAKPTRAKLVWHIHDYVSTRSVMARLLRRFSSRADAIITNSRSVADDVQGVLGSKNIFPILNVVDLTNFAPTGPTIDLDPKCGLPPATPETLRIGLVATMAWWKGHRLFLKAISKLDPRVSVRGYIIGGACYQTGTKQESIDALKHYASELGIADRVGFTGFVAEPASAIRALDVVVHTSTEPEPFGRVIAEAMGCGKPVISSGVGGAAEILAMGDFSRRFAMNDASSLASAITHVVSDPSLRVRLGSNGLDTARAHFGRERLALELPPVYEGLLKMQQTTSTPANLEQARMQAAEASGGISNEVIYGAILQAVTDLDLHGSVLDFGAGTGSLARHLLRSGRFACVAAADLMEKPVDLDPVHWIRADLNYPLPAPEQSFETVIAAEVVEHLENPRSMARELYRLLKPGGVAILSTPNNESWRSLISLLVRGHHVAFCNGSYPAHITALLRTDLDRISREAGFDPPQFRFTNVEGIPGKPTTTWQQISVGSLRGLRYSDNILAICRKPLIPGGC